MRLPDGVSILWAKSKPRHPLWKHLLDASAVSLALPDSVASFPWSVQQTALMVGLHDIGKADSRFQHQRWKDDGGQELSFSDELKAAGFPTTADAPCRHERISAEFIRKWLAQNCLDAFTSDSLARAVVAHHGYWFEGAADVAKAYADAQNQLCEMLQNVLGVNTLPTKLPQGLNLSDIGMRLAGHVVLCDWIASNEDFYRDAGLHDLDDPEEYFARAKEVAIRWIHDLELKRIDRPGEAARIVETARPIQQALLDADILPGLVIIEAPMGEGKTEAAWILAEKWRNKGYSGMYMALPTMATSDSLHTRYRDDYLKKLEPEGVARLVHGMAWLRDDKEPKKALEVGEPGDDHSLAAAWFRPTRRAMLAAHGVGTVDQAMLAGMNVKFGFLRLCGLTDRVLVIDEVHAYDAYMSAIISRLLNWCSCLRIPVVMLSATLSARQRAAMIEAYGSTGGDPGPNAPYPLITVAAPEKDARVIETEASSSRTLRIQTRPGLLGDAQKTARLAEELAANGGCCCVILNTVRQAQEVYRKLKLPEEEKLLFHARFTAADREIITNRVLEMFGKDKAKRPSKFVLVATQVVEQSLDVDFDHMISEIAPIDLLLQRSGRMHRHHTRVDDPALHALLPTTADGKPLKFGASERIYQRYPLLRTVELLKETDRIRLPDDFRRLVEAVYGAELPAGAPKDLKESKQEWQDLQEGLTAQAGEFLLCQPMADEFDPVGADEVGDDCDDGNGWRGRTRLGLDDVLVVPLTKRQLERYGSRSLHPRLVRYLYRRSVKIPPYFWPLRPAKGYGQPILGRERLRGVWLLPVEQNEEDRWSWSGIREDGKSYEISYDRKIGLTHGGEK